MKLNKEGLIKQNNLKLVPKLGMMLVTLGWILIFVLIIRWVARQEDTLWLALFLALMAIPLFGLIVFAVCLPYVPFTMLDQYYNPEKYLPRPSRCPKCGENSYFHEGKEEWNEYYCKKCGYRGY